MTDAPLLAGNNVAVMVAAAELARRGRPPILLTDGRPLGGHFAGLEVDGNAYDLGMVMLEKLPSTEPDARLASYRGDVRNDWTRFGDLAANWLDEQLTLRRTPTPQCLWASSLWPDYLIANRLDILASADVVAPDLLNRGDPRHATNKSLGLAYDRLCYAEASQLNHGRDIHDLFIEPFVRKLLNVSSTEFLARYHRAAWAPLFHPQTISEALRGEATLPEYPFWVPESSHVGGLVTHMTRRLAADGVRVVTQPLSTLKFQGGCWTASTADGAIWSAPRMALGLAPERARSLIGLPSLPPMAGASVSMLLARVKSTAIGRPSACLMVVDKDFAAYRLTDQDALAGRDTPWHRVVLEANPEVMSRLAADWPIESLLRRELAQLMAVDDPTSIQVDKCVTARNALTFPTAEAVAQAAHSHALLSELTPGVALTGALLGYGVASLNDQIVQGLKIAEDHLS